MAPQELSGKAKLVAWTLVQEPAAGLEALVPYIIGIVEAEEGCRLTARIVDVEQDELEAGLDVEARFRRLGESGPAGVIHYGYCFGPPVA